MEVFKFGGASVKDADSVKNILSVLQKKGVDNKLIVVSAMGKTTNALEKVIHAYFTHKNELSEAIEVSHTYHFTILSDLFASDHPIFETVQTLFNNLQSFLERNKSPNYDFVYDQVICYGELIATKIISAFLSENHIKNTWIFQLCFKPGIIIMI